MSISGASILITGGSGTFGNAYAKYALRNNARRVVIYSRDELKQAEMERNLEYCQGFKNLRLFIGDVRDVDRLELAMQDIDIVIHAAAMKRIEVCERDPLEAIKTNVVGSSNVIIAALRTNVRKAIALSTDKACDPVNLYGATKMAMERVFIAANNLSAGRCKFSVVRYGNIAGSRGSVIPLWKQQIDNGEPIRITEPEATRFYMTLDEAVGLVSRSIGVMCGGEVFTPDRLPAYKLADLAKAMGVKDYYQIIGLPGWEKLHEALGDGQTSDTAPRLTVDDLKKIFHVDKRDDHA